ncbi:hypothetical protein RhiirC2_799532 [Rhizophagus irregularis]|uniref:Uncharacterized protein n=1 Tax=Rhizophagus irregularis TaxID=588596 RepID=A0A2N1M4Z8_9GLOM|nr:hypothetical protein RhiirC2_799532 [Rhizophagus irregularis]
MFFEVMNTWFWEKPDDRHREVSEDLWSLRFYKYAFRIFPSNLTKDERNLHFKYWLIYPTCPENQRKRNLSSTHEKFTYQSDESEGMHNWDEQVEQEIPLQGPLSYAEAAKKIKTVPNVRANVLTSSQGPSQCYKEKEKQQETQEPVRKPWNQQNINPTPVNNEGDRLDRLERQMEKFMNMIQRLNERVSNLEINHINQAEILSNRKVELSFAKDDNTFMNNNNKRVKEFQQTRDVYIDKNISPNVQTRTLSPMEEDNEVNKTVETEKFIYEPSTALGTSPSSPKNQEGNTQRLDNFEAKMDQAFSMLTNTTGNLTFI